jgi:RND family efflux transporter MFP subunit
MNRTVKIILAGLLAILLLVVGWWVLRLLENDIGEHPSTPSATQDGSDGGIGIATAKPATRRFTSLVPWTGVVEPQARVRLIARAAGRIEKIDAADESPVKAGGLVMLVGGPRVESERATRQAAIEALESRLAVARQSVARLRQDLAERLATKETLAAAEQTKLQIEGDLHRARLELDGFEKTLLVAAPMDGIFTGRRASVGQTVQVGDCLGEVVAADGLRIQASLFAPPDTGLVGKKVRLRTSGNEIPAGKIARVLPDSDISGAVRVWVRLSSGAPPVRPGQSVGGVVLLDERTSLAVPASAVVYDADGHAFVFVRDSGGEFRKHGVRPGTEESGWAEIRTGLEISDSVVVRGAYELFFRDFDKQYAIED